MNTSAQQFLQALNIPRYVLRVDKPKSSDLISVTQSQLGRPQVAPTATSGVPSGLDVTDGLVGALRSVSGLGPTELGTSQKDTDTTSIWTQLEQKVKTCQRCTLAQTRTQTVFGSGNRQAKLMLIGEAPGMNEDKQGLPFVGRAGQLLTQMLAAIGIAREDVYIANMLKCRPPNNRDPKPEEVASCADYLQQQVALVQPKLIVALGRIAAQGLLNVTTPLGRLRGQTHRYADGITPMLVTYHPAYLLRNPADKRKAFEDLRAVQSQLG